MPELTCHKEERIIAPCDIYLAQQERCQLQGEVKELVDKKTYELLCLNAFSSKLHNINDIEESLCDYWRAVLKDLKKI